MIDFTKHLHCERGSFIGWYFSEISDMCIILDLQVSYYIYAPLTVKQNLFRPSSLSHTL